MNFKIGDRIRKVRGHAAAALVGDTGVVTDLENSNSIDWLRVALDHRHVGTTVHIRMEQCEHDVVYYSPLYQALS